jgi:hypothetical protein
MNHVLCLLHHLAFRNPERGFCNGHGKIVDFDAVKLPNGNLNGIAEIQHDLAPMQKRNDLVLQPPQGQIGLCQKVTGAAGGVYVPTDFDTKEKALFGAKAAEKGLK